MLLLKVGMSLGGEKMYSATRLKLVKAATEGSAMISFGKSL